MSAARINNAALFGLCLKAATCRGPAINAPIKTMSELLRHKTSQTGSEVTSHLTTASCTENIEKPAMA
jgi:hypothetical protein